MTMRHMRGLRRTLFTGAAIAMGVAGTLGVAGTVRAQAAADPIQTQYERDVQRCNSGQGGQDIAACLREAGAARDEARRNRLDDGQSANYRTNSTARCDNLPPAQREDCLRQMASPTRVKGSVESGGVLRETVIPVPARPTGVEPDTAAPTQAQDAPSGDTMPVPVAPGVSAIPVPLQ